MIRSLCCFGGIFLAVVVSCSSALQFTGRFDVVGLVVPLREVDATYQRGFRSDTMARMNRKREPLGLGIVQGDEPLQAWLLRYVSSHPEPESVDLENVFENVQTNFPGAQYLAANLVTSPDRESLLANLSDWGAATNPDFDTVNTAVFVKGRRYGALAVMARRIPRFSLREANEKGGRFYNACPHCGETHALELDRESRTLILSCPYCDLPFDVLALDTRGQIRRASDFLEGFDLIEADGSGNWSDRDRVVELWRRVADRCEYASDHTGFEEQEVWKTPTETWMDRSGDCEDTSILLADILLSAGFDARVAIGWNGNIGQHAWVVVQIDESQHVIETTLQEEIDADSLMPVEEASAFYQPEQLFDRGNIYYTTAQSEHFGRDYFSSEHWKVIPMTSEREAYALSRP